MHCATQLGSPAIARLICNALQRKAGWLGPGLLLGGHKLEALGRHLHVEINRQMTMGSRKTGRPSSAVQRLCFKAWARHGVPSWTNRQLLKIGQPNTQGCFASGMKQTNKSMVILKQTDVRS